MWFYTPHPSSNKIKRFVFPPPKKNKIKKEPGRGTACTRCCICKRRAMMHLDLYLQQQGPSIFLKVLPLQGWGIHPPALSRGSTSKYSLSAVTEGKWGSVTIDLLASQTSPCQGSPYKSMLEGVPTWRFPSPHLGNSWPRLSPVYSTVLTLCLAVAS